MKNENNKAIMGSKSKKTISKVSESKDITIAKFEDLEGKFLHIKVGNSDLPATDDQISNIETAIVDLFEKNNINCLVFVTHHAVSIDIVEKEK